MEKIMKKEHEEYFSAKFHELADKFGKVAARPRPDIKSSTGPAFEVDVKAAEEFSRFSEKIYMEFKQAGYNDDDWNNLMWSSGAGKRMGMGA